MKRCLAHSYNSYLAFLSERRNIHCNFYYYNLINISGMKMFHKVNLDSFESMSISAVVRFWKTNERRKCNEHVKESIGGAVEHFKS